MANGPRVSIRSLFGITLVAAIACAMLGVPSPNWLLVLPLLASLVAALACYAALFVKRHREFAVTFLISMAATSASLFFIPRFMSPDRVAFEFWLSHTHPLWQFMHEGRMDYLRQSYSVCLLFVSTVVTSAVWAYLAAYLLGRPRRD
jgi:hypothetical protein